MAEFEGKVALVTGSARGIGRAVAELLARSGARVAVTARRLEAAEGAAEAISGNAMAVELEVADATSVAAAVAKVIEVWGRIDVLVNNAGVTQDNLALRMKLSDWQAVLDTNLTGAFLCTKECLRPMVRARGGAVDLACGVLRTRHPPSRWRAVRLPRGLLTLEP